MESCNVLIIGGGPAGSSCARELRREGLDVVIMDKKEFPRDKVCAGWITPAVVQSLKIDTHDYANGRVFQAITGFRIGVLGRKQVDVNYDHVVSYGILRNEFDDYLLRRCGARLRLGEEPKTIARNGHRWRVNDSIEADLIIGAGGHFCPVARYLGAKARREIVVVAQEVELEMTPRQSLECAIHAEMPELFTNHDLNGYAWCFRKGNHLNIGAGREGKSVGAQTQEFMRFLKSLGRIPEDIPSKARGHAYIIYGRTRRELLGDGMLLIGDAAGLAYPWSGEGIRAAVESGIMAAESISSLKGDFSRSRLARYVKRLTSRFGKPKVFRQPTGANAALQRMLIGTRWFARHVLLDSYILQRRQPALVTESRDLALNVFQTRAGARLQ